jgi:hypothetical protein
MKQTTKRPNIRDDVHDDKDLSQELQNEETTLDLPEVKDIPGQEHIRPPRLKGFTDITTSSDDEEGVGILDNLNSEETLDPQANVTPEEVELLEKSLNTSGVEQDADRLNAQLDNIDEDGEPLNEQTDLSGQELDVPASEEDDYNEEIGEEDEENNYYSRGQE